MQTYKSLKDYNRDKELYNTDEDKNGEDLIKEALKVAKNKNKKYVLV